MLQVSVRHLRHLGVPIATLLLVASVMAYGQSLGDVARESRERKSASTVPPKVITDVDLAKAAGEPEQAGESSKVRTASLGETAAGRATATSAVGWRATEQWRKQILAQKRTVATLEKRLARFQASVSYVDASAISRGEILSRSQALQQERLAQVREQLEEQRAKLLEMQEEARRAGMHTQVYDP